MSTINKQVLIIVISLLAIVNATCWANSSEPNFNDFYQILQKGSDEDKETEQTGQKIFERLERKYRADTGFGALKSKMTAAEFLANQMVTQLTKATNKQMLNIAGDLFKTKTQNQSKNALSVAPAKNFYDTSQQIFSNPVNISNLEEEEKKFLASYYDLKLRIMINEIAKAGQALSIAEPSFKGTYDYVLVLPLLHSSETRPINMDVFPKWMNQSSQFNIFSDSCLLHYGFAYYAQVFAKAAAELDKRDFSQVNFYKSASQKSAAQKLPNVAVDCLKRAIDSIAKDNVDERIGLQFDIVQIWLDADNFVLAAGEAKNIADNFPNHKKTGNAIWFYFYALSRANDAETILKNIDTALSDSRCSDYKAKLMYVKWWALRRQKGQEAQIAAIEHQLITDYGNDPMVAPIMLSRATDLLASQDYAGALAMLQQIQEKFPTSAAASQAIKMIEKLKTTQKSK